MSEIDRIGDLREKEGFKARKKGDEIHEGASEEFTKGYKGFSSNVTPRNFGRTGLPSADWNCVCGQFNKGRVKYLFGGKEVCSLCKQDREYVDKEKLGLEDD
jgi:hypothetical protein